MLAVDNTLLCMFQRLCTYFQDTGVLIFGGYVLSGHCNQQQISVKTEGYLFSEGYLFTGFYGIIVVGFVVVDDVVVLYVTINRRVLVVFGHLSCFLLSPCVGHRDFHLYFSLVFCILWSWPCALMLLLLCAHTTGVDAIKRL